MSSLYPLSPTNCSNCFCLLLVPSLLALLHLVIYRCPLRSSQPYPPSSCDGGLSCCPHNPCSSLHLHSCPCNDLGCRAARGRIQCRPNPRGRFGASSFHLDRSFCLFGRPASFCLSSQLSSIYRLRRHGLSKKAPLRPTTKINVWSVVKASGPKRLGLRPSAALAEQIQVAQTATRSKWRRIDVPTATAAEYSEGSLRGY